MQNRILDFSMNPVQLRTKLKQLVIRNNDDFPITIPLSDIAVIIISHPQITISQAVLTGAAEAGSVVVVCDRRSLPVGIYFPLCGHHLLARRLMIQNSTSLPMRKGTWKQIVQKKIKNQAFVLKKVHENDFGLLEIEKSVKSGDSTNREAFAAKRYWTKLHIENGFHRKPEGTDIINIGLNYGYGVLRAIVARAIVAVGFNPATGIHHHNKYNSYCLADDLMEPFRPLVDYCVYILNKDGYLIDHLTPENKGAIVSQITRRYNINGKQETIFEATIKLAESLVKVFLGTSNSLCFPKELPLETRDCRSSYSVELSRKDIKQNSEIEQKAPF